MTNAQREAQFGYGHGERVGNTEGFDWDDFRENPLKYDLFKTAYCKGINAYCSIKKVNHEQGMFLVNFGYQDIWTPAKDLSRFCL